MSNNSWLHVWPSSNRVRRVFRSCLEGIWRVSGRCGTVWRMSKTFWIFFYLKYTWNPNFLDPKFLRSKGFYGPKIFWFNFFLPHICLPNLFWTRHFRALFFTHVFWPESFDPMFLDPNIFWTQVFFAQKFVGPQIFWIQIFWAQNILDHKLLGTQFFLWGGGQICWT